MPNSNLSKEVTSSQMSPLNLSANTPTIIISKFHKLTITELFNLFITRSMLENRNLANAIRGFDKDYETIIENETIKGNKNIYLIKALSMEYKLIKNNCNSNIYLNFYKFTQQSNKFKRDQLNILLNSFNMKLSYILTLYAIIYDNILNSPNESLLKTLESIYSIMKRNLPSLTDEIICTIKNISYYSIQNIPAVKLDLAKIKNNINILINKLLKIDNSHNYHYLIYKLKFEPGLPISNINNAHAIESLLKAHTLNPLFKYSCILINYQNKLHTPKLDIFIHLAIVIMDDTNSLDANWHKKLEERFSTLTLNLKLFEMDYILRQESVAKALIHIMKKDYNSALTSRFSEFVNYYNIKKAHRQITHAHLIIIGLIEGYTNFLVNEEFLEQAAKASLNAPTQVIITNFQDNSSDLNNILSVDSKCLNQNYPNKGSNTKLTTPNKARSMNIFNSYLGKLNLESIQRFGENPSCIDNELAQSHGNIISFTQNSFKETTNIDCKLTKSTPTASTTIKTKRKFASLANYETNTQAKQTKTLDPELIKLPLFPKISLEDYELSSVDFKEKLESSMTSNFGYLRPAPYSSYNANNA